MVADRGSSPATALSSEAIVAALRAVDDPEMPINIVDLGLISDVRVSATALELDLTPTFIGCPALAMIRDRVEAVLRPVAAGRDLRVNWVMAPRWTVDRISEAGRERLRAFGVTTPARQLVQLTVSAEQTVAVPCPYCRSTATHVESPFGPTRCRMIYYCDSCRNSFEHLKPI